MSINFNFDSNLATVNAKLAKLAMRQIPFAASKALNQTGKELLSYNKIQMKKRFNNPVPYTLNAFYLMRSTKRKLVAEVRRKDKVSGKHYLDIQANGGVRPQKAVEKLVKNRVAYSGIVGSVIPVPGNGGETAKGKMNMGEVNRALAGLGASFSTTAYTRNKQRAAESKRNLVKRPSEYFVKGNEGGTKGGIYKRVGKKKIKKVFHISDAMPRYEKNLPFKAYMTKQARLTFPKNMRREMRNALRTAKFR